MKAPPLLFLGDRRREAVITRIAAASRRWRQMWSPGADDAFEAVCDAPAVGGFSEPVASVATTCWSIDVGNERTAVLLLPHSTFAWVVHEGAGALPPDSAGMQAPDSVTGKLEYEVARTLLTELCAPEIREPVSVTRLPADALPDWSRDTRAWSLHVKAPASGRGFCLLVSAARLELLAPARAVVADKSLAARRDAIGDHTVALRAVVGETSLSINELADLALDDVLVLDQHLSEPVSLVGAPSGTPVGAGNLGRAGSRRAIKVAGVNAQRN
ncbi:MAG TPA: FliM/FliN family flagellar motor C-terminal domain-containing protein [Steroidobacteraceae bacterium]